jgi:hypothetical protein
MSTYGTRDELIERLENSSIDYESLLSEELTEMLKRRSVTNSATGCKAVKIERLRLNDKIDRETGTSGESMLYGRFSALQLIIADSEDGVSGDEYSSKTPKALTSILAKRNLTCTGSISEQITRLRQYDRRRLERIRKDYNSIKVQLEEAIGHPVNVEWTFKVEDQQRAKDNQVEQEARAARPAIPVCDYKWRDSHWAVRTERELREICDRRDFPGSGTKAAMIKWLETGSVDYEDLYAGSLERMCRER